MKFIISVCIMLVVLARSNADERNCQIEGVNDDDWKLLESPTQLVDTDAAPKELFRAKQEGISFVENGLYLDAVLEAGHFVVRVSDRFRQYEEVETSTRFVETFKVICGNEQYTLKFAQDVIDTNNHYPTFLTTEFTTDLLLPTLRDADLSRYLDFQIEVRDVDITNQGVIFTIEENKYVTISNGSSSADNKNHVAVLKAKTILREVKQPLTLLITATDLPGSGKSRKSLAELTVTINNQSVAASPMFEKPLYRGSYSREEGLTLEAMKLVEGFDERMLFALYGDDGDLHDHFRQTVDANTKTLYLSLRDGVIIDENKYPNQIMAISLLAIPKGAGAQTTYTMIMISLPQPAPVPCVEIPAAEIE